MNTTARPMLMDHVRELRGRLLSSFIVFAIGAAAGYIFRAQLITYLQHPLNEKLYYTSPTGSFEIVMQICGIIGLIFALPVLIYNLLRFIEPALPKGFSKLVVATTILMSLLLAIGGAAFAYYVSLPAALKFFGSIGTNHLDALISVDQYFRFVFTYLATFAIVFQLPLVLFLVDYVTPLGPGGMRRIRKFVVVGSFLVALIIPSAPDPLSQMILALPIILLYEVSIIVVAVRARGRRRGAAKVHAKTVQHVTKATPVEKPVATHAAAPVLATRPEPKPLRPAMQPRVQRQQAIVGAQTIDLSAYRQTRSESRQTHSSNLIDLRSL